MPECSSRGRFLAGLDFGSRNSRVLYTVLRLVPQAGVGRGVNSRSESSQFAGFSATTLFCVPLVANSPVSVASPH
jgi:hypothetical protein